jgi:hypothetical protein
MAKIKWILVTPTLVIANPALDSMKMTLNNLTGS